VPVKLHVVGEEGQHSARFKKIRRDVENAQS
jgi:hypothetical protein